MTDRQTDRQSSSASYGSQDETHNCVGPRRRPKADGAPEHRERRQQQSDEKLSATQSMVNHLNASQMTQREYFRARQSMFNHLDHPKQPKQGNDRERESRTSMHTKQSRTEGCVDIQTYVFHGTRLRERERECKHETSSQDSTPQRDTRDSSRQTLAFTFQSVVVFREEGWETALVSSDSHEHGSFGSSLLTSWRINGRSRPRLYTNVVTSEGWDGRCHDACTDSLLTCLTRASAVSIAFFSVSLSLSVWSASSRRCLMVERMRKEECTNKRNEPIRKRAERLIALKRQPMGRRVRSLFFLSFSFSLLLTITFVHTHTSTQTRRYIYICMYVCIYSCPRHSIVLHSTFASRSVRSQ